MHRLRRALRSLARVADASIVIDPDVVGEVTVEMNRTTVGDALRALVEPAGFHFEETESGIVVRKMKTVLYAIDWR